MRKLILVFAVLQFFHLKAQRPIPGGVQGAYIWEITKENSVNAIWESKLTTNPDDSIVQITGKAITINNNPALNFNGQIINKSLDISQLSSFSLFTVCQEYDTVSEKVIFSIENDTAPETVLTNMRMAAIDAYRYANFNKNKDIVPKIYYYSQNKTKDSLISPHRIQLGRTYRSANLPVSAYNGSIPELIVFNRYLSLKERQKIESYLAIKYGISLNQEFPVSYLNSKGEIIWDADLNASHNHNIAGTGRDDLSGLYQKVSESTFTPGLMKIGHKNEIKNNSFLIWGDNEGELRFADEEGVRPLKREWKISAYQSLKDCVFIEASILSLNEINPFRPGETCWLMIDRSSTGNYPFKQTCFNRAQYITEQRSFFFNDVEIDPDHSGSDIFTLIAAPNFFTRSTVISPTCSLTLAGIIQTEIVGGKAPYKLTLKSESVQQYADENSMYHTFDGLSQGTYILEVTDAKNNHFTEKIRISNTHSWENKLSDNYTIIEGQTLDLDASKGMPALNYMYSWIFPDGSVLYNHSVEISYPGCYLLSVTDDNGCNSIEEITVKQSDKQIIRYFELFPNPTKGWFALRIDLRRKANVNIAIFNVSGQVIRESQLKDEYYYWYSDNIPEKGIYFIVISTQNESKTLKLLVQ